MAYNEKIIENIKVAVFDFDETLAKHINPNYQNERRKNDDNFTAFYVESYIHPDTFYDKVEQCIAPVKMQALVKELRNKGVKLYLLTGMPFSFNFQAKAAFTHKHYGDDIECLSTMNQEHKIDALKVIMKLNGCKREEILFVDDMPENIKRINAAGFIGLLSQDVV